MSEARPAPKPKASPRPKKKSVTSAITVHFPKQVRDQLSRHPERSTLHGIVAEAFNDFVAKHGKPETPAISASLETFSIARRLKAPAVK